jgi:pimeloyl-ACP methyl ester carboxylesterase
MGTLFASGLETQIQTVVRSIEALLRSSDSVSIRVVVCGLSRGGCGALLLAKAVPESTSLQLLLIDPVVLVDGVVCLLINVLMLEIGTRKHHHPFNH